MSTPEHSAARVFVVQDNSNLNLAKATKYGHLTSLLPQQTNITMSPQPVLRQLRTRLKSFTDQDFLLLLGDPIAIALAAVIASEVNNGRVKFLKFDRGLNDYFIVSADIHDRMRGDHP